MLAETLRRGFALANRGSGLIFLDLLWKSIWVVGTITAFLLAAWWVTYDLQGIEWRDTGFSATNGLIAMVLVRDFWNTHRDEVLLVLSGVIALSIAAWFILEASFRGRLVGGGSTHAPKTAFHILLLSNAAKSMSLFIASLIFAGVALAGAVTVAVVSFLAFAFLLTLVDTVIRADAVDLLGTDLFRVVGLLGILMSFEAMVTASAIALLVAGFANVAGAYGAFAMLGAAFVAVLALNILHSYLLLVRFSAVAIMRRNVIEV
jgi:MFS family permease